MRLAYMASEMACTKRALPSTVPRHGLTRLWSQAVVLASSPDISSMISALVLSDLEHQEVPPCARKTSGVTLWWLRLGLWEGVSTKQRKGVTRPVSGPHPTVTYGAKTTVNSSLLSFRGYNSLSIRER